MQNKRSILNYKNGELHFGTKQISLKSILESYRSPIYLYDLEHVRQRLTQMKTALPNVQIFYAMKANANRKILEVLKQSGVGIDVVSGGEIRRAFEVGFSPDDIIYSGVGKTDWEIAEALDTKIKQINVESFSELKKIALMARQRDISAPVALRLNPNIDIKTHPYIATGLHENKFGMEISALPELKRFLRENRDHLRLVAISLHLGSQMLEFSGFRQALKLLRPIFEDLRSDFTSLECFDFGGGLGIIYEEGDLSKEALLLKEYSQVVAEEFKGFEGKLQTEPGRWLVGHAGILLTQLLYIKETPYKSFLVVDSGMNHLLRPALYQAYHGIYPVNERAERAIRKYDIVGPICESADFFAKDRQLHEPSEGDFFAIADVGAYGFSMANTYNLQDLPEESVIGDVKSHRH